MLIEPTAFEKYLAYMNGWRDAAGRRGLRRDFETHPTLGEYYKAGVESGRESEKTAGAEAAEIYGYVPQIMRTMSGEPDTVPER